MLPENLAVLLHVGVNLRAGTWDLSRCFTLSKLSSEQTYLEQGGPFGLFGQTFLKTGGGGCTKFQKCRLEEMEQNIPHWSQK